VWAGRKGKRVWTRREAPARRETAFMHLRRRTRREGSYILRHFSQKRHRQHHLHTTKQVTRLCPTPPPTLSRLAQTVFVTVASSPRVESSDLSKVYCPATSAASAKLPLPSGDGSPPFISSDS
jgi:hypothetical protein